MKGIQVHRRNQIRSGRVFDITLENVTFPNGANRDMEIIRHPGASAVVPLTDDNNVLMLKQYRHAVGRVMWEIPAGTFEKNENPLSCASRELKEETGFEAQAWESLGAVTPVPGYSDERIHLFLAQELAPSVQQLDADEFIEVQPLPLSQVAVMITSGEIEDAKTIAAIFRTLHHLHNVSY